ncbi:carotenoid oxygenase family protein [Streptomyces sp. NPDC017638]|uniref:carotenoid oxygenase family protein n=1 Tax=Streptomyces sp. NPDC017638 TaxID=3365004 RepID=UPI0037A65A0B
MRSNLPFELTDEPATVGAYDFDGKLTNVMTAHPKHDFAITERYVVFVEGTVTFDRTETSGIPYAWKDEQPARIGVMPRGRGGAASIRWFDVEPGSMLHAANAYEDAQGGIVLEGPTVDREGFRTSWNWWVGSPDRGAVPNSRSYNRQWVIDLASGTVRERIVDDLVVEFPTINEDVMGREHRFQYAISFPDERGVGNFGVVKYDRTTGGRQVRHVGDGQLPGEAVFVPAVRPRSSARPAKRPGLPRRPTSRAERARARPRCQTPAAVRLED